MQAAEVPETGLRKTLESLGLETDLRMKAMRTGRRRAAGYAAVLMFFAVVTAAGGAWYVYLEQDPAYRPAAVAMPSPNAFTYFRTAAAEAERAARKVRMSDTSSNDEVGWPRTLEQKERLVRAAGPALRILRAGFPYAYREPPARSINHLYPHYSGYRELARALSAEADVYAARGDAWGAVQSGLDAVELGMRIQHGALAIGKFVGIACSSMGRQSVFRHMDRLSTRECREAIQRLLRLEKDRVPLTETLWEEKQAGAAMLEEVMRQPNWRMRIGELLGSNEDRQLRLLYPILSLGMSKSAHLERYLSAMDRATQIVQRYPDCFLYEFDPREENPVVRPLILSTRPLAVKDAADRAGNLLLMTSLALRAYRLENGREARSVEELVRAGYLPKVPMDPFAPAAYGGEGQGSVRLTFRDGRAVPYSIGPDLRDNGGVPIRRPYASPSSKLSTRVEFDSAGDIVAGVNEL